MCGIAGHIGRSAPSSAQIDAALRALDHRGPDSRGVWSCDLGDGYSCTLLFTRLAIQDLTAAADQPFGVGPLTLVFNGEIYNFIELRSELASSGTEFRSSGDTEVLARLLALRGVDALDAINGMFAAAWFDRADDRLTLARDSFGEKPLLLHRRSGDLWFSSEVLPLSRLVGGKFRPNQAQIRRFLVEGYRSLNRTAQTFFEGVEAVKPGEVLTVSRDGNLIDRHIYWRPSVPAHPDPITYDTAVLETRERLVESLAIRLRSDVPIALSLSGGVDSTSLLSIAVRELNTPLHTFTVVSGDSSYDDSAIARRTAEWFDVSNTSIDVRDVSFLSELERQVRSRGTPTLTISSFAQALLMREVHTQGSTVIIEGTGADEIFAGYHDHHLAFLADLHARDQEAFVVAARDWAEGAGSHTRNPYLQQADYFVRDPKSRKHLYLDAQQFAGLLRAVDETGFDEPVLAESVLRNRMLHEIFTETLPVLLDQADRNAMASSVENRSPFLDRRLAEWAFMMPDDFLIRSGIGKALLRDAVSPWAPATVIWDSEKRGFNLSLSQVINSASERARADILRDSPIWEVVDRGKMIEWLWALERLSPSTSKFLFAFYSIRAFLEALE